MSRIVMWVCLALGPGAALLASGRHWVVGAIAALLVHGLCVMWACAPRVSR